MRENARLFVVDPVCVLNYGHNPQSLIYFSDYFSSRGYDCYPVASRYFRPEDPKYSGFMPHFGYYYQETLPLPANIDISIDAEVYVAALGEAATILTAAALTDEPLTNQALIDWHLLFQSCDLSQKDFIFYPSADYYGVLGLLYYLRFRSAHERPTVHLRFIGVMENARNGGGDTLRAIRAALQGLEGSVTVSAEAPAYASYLARHLRTRVTITLYPPYRAFLPHDREPGDDFVVFSAGAGREDKGFLRLLNIARKYAISHPSDEVRFVIQNLRADDETRHVDYMSQLYAAPNVELIKAVQSDEAMLANFQRCDFSIMPYDETYRMRGSAVFMESIMYGRSIAISRKTGFEPLLPMFVSGAAATSDDEFCEAIHASYCLEASQRQALCRRTRDAYTKYAYAGLGNVFQQVAP